VKPSPDAFEQWRHSPVTEWLLDIFLVAEMERTKRTFQDQAWSGSEPDLVAHRERYETLEWIRGLDMELIEQTIGMQDG
jgi:hypothetical protein